MEVQMANWEKKLVLTGTLLLLTGCADYKASSLSSIPSETVIISGQERFKQEPAVSVSCKVFDRKDCERYLGRNILSKGYVPIQLTIRNETNDSMYLSSDHFNVSLTPPKEVAEKVHTSTVGRVCGWAAAGLFFSPFIIPAIYDGVMSSKANRSLDKDYGTKTLRECTILPYTQFNGIIFLSKSQWRNP